MAFSIRKTEPSDAQGLHALYSQPNAYTATLQLPLPTLLMWQHRLNSTPENVHSFVAVNQEQIVGNLGLEVYTNPRRKHAGMIGMAVHDDFVRRGIGSALLEAAIDYAENWLNLSRIELTVYVDNQPAISLYEKYRFVREGRAKDFAFRDGNFADAFFMARVGE